MPRSVQLWVLLWSEEQNTVQPTLLVKLRRPSRQDFALKTLQLTRTYNHLLVQHLFPRTHLQLRKFLLVSNSRCLGRAARVPCNRARNNSCQCHTVKFILYTVRIHCIGGCIADVCNLQTHHHKPLIACLYRHNLQKM